MWTAPLARSVIRQTLSIWIRALFIANGGLWLSVLRWQDVQVDPEQDRRARELQQLHGASPSMTVRQPLAAERWTASRKAM